MHEGAIPSGPDSEHPDTKMVPVVDQAFSEHSSRRCMALVYHRSDTPFVGTGTVLTHGGELFVVTCGHVATDFMAGGSGQAVMMGDHGHPLESSDFELVEISKADPDIALLRIKTQRPYFGGLLPIVLGDTVGDFNFTDEVAAYALCGFPSQQVKKLGEQVQFHPLTIVARCLPDKTTESSLALDYPRDLGGKHVPDARGLSGSLVWALRQPKEGELWSPGPVIAIQHAWSEGQRYVRCDPLALLHDWLR